MIRTTWLIMLSIMMLIGCTEKEEEGAVSPTSDQKPVVSVSNYPLQYFTERLAPWIEVRFPAHASGDPVRLAHRLFPRNST